MPNEKEVNRPIKILIAEDEPRIRNLLAGKIAKLVPDCQVVALASNGKEALEKVQECRPDVVFTDIKMPVMDGLELSRQIKSQYASIYVVIISGYSDFSFAQQAIRYGVFNYLLKPLENDKLLETVEEIRRKLEESSSLVPSGLVTRSIQSSVQSVEGITHGHKCYLFTVCFYNLCYDSRDECLSEYYAENLSRLDWGTVFDGTPVHGCEWVVADEYAANQKSILLMVPEQTVFSPENTAQLLQQSICGIYPGLEANICCHQSAIQREEVWIYTKRLRHILENQVVPASPRIFILERDELRQEEEIFDTVRLRVQNNAKALLKAGDYNSLSEELKSIFQFVMQNHAPQKQVVKAIQHIFKLLEYFLERYEERKTEEAQRELLRTLSISQEQEKIIGMFSFTIDRCLLKEESEKDNQKLREEILRYVEEHYTTISSVETGGGYF